LWWGIKNKEFIYKLPSLQVMPKEKLITAGGQAVIEGVMMRSTNHVAIAVRKPNNKISVKKEKLKPLGERCKVLAWPFIRGVFNLAEMLVLGVKALNYSANESAEEEEEQLSEWHIVLSIVIAFGFAILLFKFVPLLLAQLASDTFPFVKDHYIVFNLIDGLLKILLFVLYVLIISAMKDVNRLFQYHGAEHKAVHCYEAKKKLTIDNVKKYSTLHPRCGTSFILIVLVLSILVYTFIPQSFSFLEKLLLRLALLPVIAGISYEILRLAGKFSDSIIMRIVVWPGMMVERITTREPDRNQIEVAIKALDAVLKEVKKDSRKKH
jgi:uncharacterized protein YqhQ